LRGVDPRIRLRPIGRDEDAADLGSAEVAVFAGSVYASWGAGIRFADVVERMPALRWIHSLAAGLDELATPELAARDIVVTNSAGVYAPAIAEWAIAALVMLARDLGFRLDAQRRGDWTKSGRPDAGFELGGARLGIVGYGGIGERIAVLARAFGMHVWAIRRRPAALLPEPLERLLGPDELPALLRRSDAVVLATGINASTRRLIGTRELRLLPRGALLVNVARGGLIDTDALLAALHDGHLGGAALDVTDPEPLPADHPLWRAPRTLVTPHVSGDTPEGEERAAGLLCANLRLYAAGHPEHMANRVDLRDHL
jgi:phosphoglycerate dehydrogenase-like enzyme